MPFAPVTESIRPMLAKQTELVRRWAAVANASFNNEQRYYRQAWKALNALDLRLTVAINSGLFLDENRPHPSHADILRMAGQIAHVVHDLKYARANAGGWWVTEANNIVPNGARTPAYLVAYMDGVVPERGSIPKVDVALIAHCFRLPIEVWELLDDEQFQYWVTQAQEGWDLFSFGGLARYDDSLRAIDLAPAPTPQARVAGATPYVPPSIPANRLLRFEVDLPVRFSRAQALFFEDDGTKVTLISTKAQTNHNLLYEGTFQTPREGPPLPTAWFDPTPPGKTTTFVTLLVAENAPLRLDELELYRGGGMEGYRVLDCEQIADLRRRLFALPREQWCMLRKDVAVIGFTAEAHTQEHATTLRVPDMAHVARAALEDDRPGIDAPDAVRPLLTELAALQSDPWSEHDTQALRWQVAMYEQVLGLVAYGPLWAAIQGARASALRSLGDLSGDAAVLREAVSGCDAALRVQTEAAMPADWAMTQNNRASALQSLGALSGDAAVLHEAVVGYDAALRVYTEATMPVDWARTQSNRSNALQRLGAQSGDAAVLREAVAGYDAALRVLTEAAMPADWARTHSNLASALQSLGDLSGDAAALHAAVAGYDAALRVLTEAAMPADWAMTQNHRATALAHLGALSGDPTVLHEAVTGFDAALAVRTREPMLLDLVHETAAGFNTGPRVQRLRLREEAIIDITAGDLDRVQSLQMRQDWGMTRNRRATALGHLGALSDDAAVLHEAVTRLDAAPLIVPRDAMPNHWALMSVARADALQALAHEFMSADALAAAIAAYDSSLKDLTHEGAVAVWTAIMVRRATARAHLGEVSGDVDRLRAAIADYDSVLAVCDPRSDPSRWAVVRHDQAYAMRVLGERTCDLHAMRHAVEGLDWVLAIKDQPGMPIDRAWVHAERAKALASLGELSGDLRYLETAIAGFDAALTTLPSGNGMMEWANATLDRAVTCCRLGELTHDATILCQARAAFDAALKAFAADSHPIEWTLAMAGRGATLALLGDLHQPAALEQALDTFSSVWHNLPAGIPNDLGRSIAASLADLILRRGANTADCVEAEAIARAALSRSDPSTSEMRSPRAVSSRDAEKIFQLHNILSLCQQIRGNPGEAFAMSEVGRIQLEKDFAALSIEPGRLRTVARRVDRCAIQQRWRRLTARFLLPQKLQML